REVRGGQVVAVLLDAGDELGDRGLGGREPPLREATAAACLQRGAEVRVGRARRARSAPGAPAAAEEPAAAEPAVITTTRRPSARAGGSVGQGDAMGLQAGDELGAGGR